MIISMTSLIILLSGIILNVVLPAKALDPSGISVVMGNKQYYIDAQQTGNLFEGVHFCAQYDMALASIENSAEYNKLYAILKTNNILDRPYWLSAIKMGTNIFTSLGTGKAVNYWGDGQSQNSATDKCLSAATTTFAITATDCINTANFICEKPLVPNCGRYGQCRYTYSYNTN